MATFEDKVRSSVSSGIDSTCQRTNGKKKALERNAAIMKSDRALTLPPASSAPKNSGMGAITNQKMLKRGHLRTW